MGMGRGRKIIKGKCIRGNMSGVVRFVLVNPPTTLFSYNVIGSNVGAVTTSNRAALKRRASNTASGVPCCFKSGSVLG